MICTLLDIILVITLIVIIISMIINDANIIDAIFVALSFMLDNRHHDGTVGGAWIIGYKLWCALIGRTLSSMGVLTIVPDYRNFPQGDIEDMISDITAAVKWVSNNALKHGGDPEKIVLAGQSAGLVVHDCEEYIHDDLEKKFHLLL